MKFYSQSKRRMVEISEAHGAHLVGLKGKIERGEYRDINGDPPSMDDESELLQEIDGELSRRSEAAAHEGGGQ